MIHLDFFWSVYQGNLQNCLELTSLFLSGPHSNLSWDCHWKDSASLTFILTNPCTTSLECTSMVIMLITFIRSRMSRGLVTLLISLLIRVLMTSTHSFIAPSAPDESSSKALLTSSVQTIWVVKRAICAQ